MRKLPMPVLVGAAVATFAGAAAFAVVSTTTDGAATAATTALATTVNAPATKTATTLSVAVSKPTIMAGRLDVISGTLTAGSLPAGRRIVELYRYDAKAKKWIPIRVNLTHKGGAVRFAVRPLATGEYEMVYHGNPKLAAAHSSPVTITVTT